MFRIETHSHTKPASACAGNTGAEMARGYKEAGYDGLIITDHFFNGNSGIDRSLPWEQKVDLFCEGYYSAKEEGDKIGLKVFFGFEYNHAGAEFLVLNLTPQWLKDHPEVMEYDLVKVFDLIHEHGGFIIHAHPYREAPYLYMIRLYQNHVDAVEVKNGGNVDRANIMANIYADAYGFPKTCGSDQHWVPGLRGNGMEFDEDIDTIEDFINLLKQKKGRQLINFEAKPFKDVTELVKE